MFDEEVEVSQDGVRPGALDTEALQLGESPGKKSAIGEGRG